MIRLRSVVLLCGATLVSIVAVANTATPAPASGGHSGHDSGKPVDRQAMWQKSLQRAPLAVTVAFDPQGRLWRARVRDGHVWLDSSEDLGRTYSSAQRVNPGVERIGADGENRPKLAFGSAGEIYVSWTQSLDVPFSGHVRFARSRDGGRSFDAPVTVNDDRQAISHRFESMAVTPDGHIHLVWLDKRLSQAATRVGLKYQGISVYAAVSSDRGASFAPNRKLADHSCECCRIALATDTDGTPVALWRHVFGSNIRDHALLRLDGQSALRRVSHENWAVDACPHHGPALSIGPDGVYHLAWYSGAEKQRGLFYANSRDRGRSFTPAVAFGNNAAQAGHAQVLSLGRNVLRAWREFDGKQSVLLAQRSRDGGKTWNTASALATSESASDRPLLVSNGKAVLLSWNSVAEGHRLIPVGLPEAP